MPTLKPKELSPENKERLDKFEQGEELEHIFRQLPSLEQLEAKRTFQQLNPISRHIFMEGYLSDLQKINTTGEETKEWGEWRETAREKLIREVPGRLNRELERQQRSDKSWADYYQEQATLNANHESVDYQQRR
jgi:hypothetical protein